MKEQFIQFVRRVIRLFPRLFMVYRYVVESWHLNEVPQATSQGFKFIGNKSMQEGNFETEETQIVNRIIPNVDIVINVGANIGYYCCIALSHDKDVVAFEPINLNTKYLLRNIKANNWQSKIEVYPMALSNKVGVVDIFGGGTGASLLRGWNNVPDQYVTLVPTTTLDHILSGRFQSKKCFIIVDIEGAELLMLEGASSFIDKDPKPIWMIEIEVSEHQPNGLKINPNLASTFHLFWSKGYEVWTADEQCRMIYPDEIEAIVENGVDTICAHNFLFFEKGKKSEYLHSE